MIALVAAGALLCLGWAGARGVLARTAFVSHRLPPDAVTAFAAVCPPGYLAVSAGVAAPAARTTLLGVRPVSVHGFAFRFGNAAGNGRRRITAAAACRRSRSGRTLLRLRSVQQRRTVAPHSVASAGLSCPRQTTPAGWGVELGRGRGATGAFAGSPLEVRGAVATVRGVRLTIADAGRRAQPVVLYATCLTAVSPAGAPRTLLRVSITTFTDPVERGLQRLEHRCPAGRFAVGVGFALSSGAAHLEGAVALAVAGRWWVDAAAATTVRTQLTCGRLG
jgi:hypothetical protein